MRSTATGRSGIIPAYAGSTFTRRSTAGTTVGSSPHTRGARLMVDDGIDSRRIIPAYAGSTAAAPPAPTTSRDHPRIRGEHQLALIKPGDLVGSSPHTRGARQAILPVSSLARIIPAYAGSTLFSLDAIHHTRDHPRIRGEHCKRCHVRQRRVGSSPHTRGALADIADRFPDYEDHPRIRGEHRHKGEKHAFQTGSSPHTRGAPHALPRRGLLGGIIPAYAGSTPAGAGLGTAPGDHPRIRGEHLAFFV